MASFDTAHLMESGIGVARQFTSLNISSSYQADGVNQVIPRKMSWWRWWNQRSRFQRSIMYMLGLLMVIAFILLAPSLTKYQVAEPGISHHRIKDSFSLKPENKEIPDDRNRGPFINSKAEESQIHKDNLVKINIGTNEAHPDAVIFKGPGNERQVEVVNAFKHAWKAYKEYAWGHDHLKPVTKTYHDWFGLGLTIIDSLDTMYIMNLENEYQEARSFIADQLKLNINKDVNLFESTIRILGGLLGIYHLTKDDLFLKKAIEIGDLLLPAFSSGSKVPYSDVNLYTHHAHAPRWGPDSSVSEVTTIQLEFKELSLLTGDPKYEKAVDKVSEIVHNLHKEDGLVPMYINAETGNFRPFATITVGARGDSYYEYLLKQWLQTGKTRDVFVRDYNESISGMMKRLVKTSEPNKLVFVGELHNGKNFQPKMDHLVCYLPSVLALGAHNGLPDSHLKFAENLLYTCYQMYAQMPTFLSPEIAHFNMVPSSDEDIFVKINDAHNLLRPETIESLWYLYHLTGNHTYQDWGWQIFQAFEKYCKVEGGGYTSIDDVKDIHNPKPRDMMESFFLSETLKYLYLLFSNDQTTLSLDRYVFNSEAHPLPIRNSS